jgi:AcrR family transcriptional regulator
MAIASARAKQKDETRRRLFRAACELFAKLGYHGTTVASIARKAGVAKGTFFVHFATKDTLILELVRLQVRAALEQRNATFASSRSPLAALRATVMALGTEAARSRELSRAVLSAGLANAEVAGDTDALFGAVHEQMLVDAQDAIDAGELGKNNDADTVASTLMASYLGATLHFTSSRRSPAVDSLLERFVNANIAGFVAAESI